MGEMKHWSKVEESILRQKARINWLKLGDNDTEFFFTITKARYSKNRISKLIDSNGHSITDQQGITTEIIGFYKNLLGSCAKYLHSSDLTTVTVGSILCSASSAHLIKDVTKREIENALARINNSKAAGLDGFNVMLFKKSWEVIKKNMVEGIMEFFSEFFHAWSHE